MISRLLLLFLFLPLSLQAKFFYEAPSYEEMYMDSELVIEGEWLGGKQVVIQKFYKNNTSEKTRDTLTIVAFDKLSIPQNSKHLFLFLKSSDAYVYPDPHTRRPIEFRPAEGSGELASAAVIWYDSTGCSRYNNKCTSCFLELLPEFTDTTKQHRLHAEDLRQRLQRFIPHYENFIMCMNSDDSISKGTPCLNYLFQESTPSPSYYALFSTTCVALQQNNWLNIISNHTNEFILLLKNTTSANDIWSPLLVIEGNDSTEGKYPDELVPVLKTLREQHPEASSRIIVILEKKHNREAVYILRSLLKSPDKSVREDAAISLCWAGDNPSYAKVKKILVNSDWQWEITLQALNELSHKKTKRLIRELLDKYPSGSTEYIEIFQVLEWIME